MPARKMLHWKQSLPLLIKTAPPLLRLTNLILKLPAPVE
jgi:hypothetical protein